MVFNLLGTLLIFNLMTLSVKAFELKYNESKKIGDKKLTVAFTGDILVHKDLYLKVINEKETSFLSLWRKTIPLIEKADLTYGNLEGPTALGINDKKIDIGDIGFKYDDSVYSGTNKLFNYHPQIVTDLKASGFDIVSTANNHSLDRGSIGIDKTIDAMESRSFNFVGTRKKNSKEEFYKITTTNDFKIAWISCTEMLNGFNDKYSQILLCYKQSDEIIKIIQKIKKSNLADLIFVLPHWGVEYKHEPNEEQKKQARLYAEAGADAILGSHPHVLQNVEKYTAEDGREIFIAYSLGNFLANQKDIDKKTSAFVYLEFYKSTDEKGLSKSWINSYKYQPTFRQNKEIIPAALLPDVVKHAERFLGEFKP